MIIAITGPTGSGKTTISRLLCKKFDRCVRVDIDSVKHFIESGFYYDESVKGKQQWALLVKNIIDLVKNYQEAKYTVIIEGYIDIGFPGWSDIFAACEVSHKFMLLPSIEENIQRDLKRPKDIQMSENNVRQHQQYFLAQKESGVFQVIDSSGESPSDTVERVYKFFV
jgi:adenylate kinase family enzyme